MKLTGKYQPSVGMEIEDRIYEPASLIMNDLYSNLDAVEPILVVDLWEGNTLIKERVYVATLFDYIKDENSDVAFDAFSTLKTNNGLSDMYLED